MKTVKFIIFVVGLFLINYVGGLPHDSRNLFITHTIFLAPLLVDFFPLLKINSLMKWIVRIIWVAGILALVLNILGVAGIINVNENYQVMFAPEYLAIFPLNLDIQTHLLWLEIVYGFVFVGTLTLSYQLEEVPQEKTNKSEKGLQKHVHT